MAGPTRIKQLYQYLGTYVYSCTTIESYRIYERYVPEMVAEYNVSAGSHSM
jgi:hypothetical protein